MNDHKGLELVWLTETDLTNLNSGEGGTNFVDVKKYKKENIEYPYVSGQAMRFYLRESVRKSLPENAIMCTPDDKGETCGNIAECWNCDLFGFMATIKGQGAVTRVSPVKVSPAIGLLPMDDNSTIDFLTRKKRVGEGEKASGDIVNIELGVNLYKCGVSFDLCRIGHEEEILEKTRNIELKKIIESDDEYKNRVKSVVEGIRYLTDYSKQARLLTDFTPDILLASLQTRYSHRLQKAFEVDQNKELDISRFKAIISDLKDYSTIYFGMISNVVKNEDEVKQAAKELELEILQPNEVFNRIINEIK